MIIDFNTFEGQNQNVERARIKGVELGYQLHGEAWSARAELTLQDPRDETHRRAAAAPFARSAGAGGES